jgi:hypothetical protein
VRILTFSPIYPKGHEMRFRIMDARFFNISSEATHFAILEPNPTGQEPEGLPDPNCSK